MNIREFNPYRHLTEARTLAAAKAAAVLDSLSDADKAAIENGGYVDIGPARYWCPERRHAARRRHEFVQDWC